MISQLVGTVVDVGGNWAVVSLGGLGLKVWCPPHTVMGVGRGDPVTMETSLVVREDALTLYGFATVGERDTFELLLSVAGVGPKLALAIVSVLPPDDLAAALASGNVSALTRVPGIGAKSAQRLILELKGKVTLLASVSPASASEPQLWRDQVREGLVGLGWSTKDAEAACDAVSGLASSEGASVAELMRAALQTLAKK